MLPALTEQPTKKEAQAALQFIDRLLDGFPFVGLSNYAQLLSDPRLRTVYANTIFFTLFAVSFNVGVGLLLAVLINRHMPGPLKYLFRTVYFFPVLVEDYLMLLFVGLELL